MHLDLNMFRLEKDKNAETYIHFSLSMHAKGRNPVTADAHANTITHTSKSFFSFFIHFVSIDFTLFFWNQKTFDYMT